MLGVDDPFGSGGHRPLGTVRGGRFGLEAQLRAEGPGLPSRDATFLLAVMRILALSWVLDGAKGNRDEPVQAAPEPLGNGPSVGRGAILGTPARSIKVKPWHKRPSERLFRSRKRTKLYLDLAQFARSSTHGASTGTSAVIGNL